MFGKLMQGKRLDFNGSADSKFTDRLLSEASSLFPDDDELGARVSAERGRVLHVGEVVSTYDKVMQEQSGFQTESANAEENMLMKLFKESCCFLRQDTDGLMGFPRRDPLALFLKPSKSYASADFSQMWSVPPLGGQTPGSASQDESQQTDPEKVDDTDDVKLRAEKITAKLAEQREANKRDYSKNSKKGKQPVAAAGKAVHNKPKSKKKLIAEQHRREKEMAEIANQLAVSARLDYSGELTSEAVETGSVSMSSSVEVMPTLSPGHLGGKKENAERPTGRAEKLTESSSRKKKRKKKSKLQDSSVDACLSSDEGGNVSSRSAGIAKHSGSDPETRTHSHHKDISCNGSNYAAIAKLVGSNSDTCPMHRKTDPRNVDSLSHQSGEVDLIEEREGKKVQSVSAQGLSAEDGQSSRRTAGGYTSHQLSNQEQFDRDLPPRFLCHRQQQRRKADSRNDGNRSSQNASGRTSAEKVNGDCAQPNQLRERYSPEATSNFSDSYSEKNTDDELDLTTDWQPSQPILVKKDGRVKTGNVLYTSGRVDSGDDEELSGEWNRVNRRGRQKAGLHNSGWGRPTAQPPSHGVGGRAPSQQSQASPAWPSQSQSEEFQGRVKQLVEMGFSREHAEQALRKNSSDIHGALSDLLRTSQPDNTSPGHHGSLPSSSSLYSPSAVGAGQARPPANSVALHPSKGSSSSLQVSVSMSSAPMVVTCTTTVNSSVISSTTPSFSMGSQGGSQVTAGLSLGPSQLAKQHADPAIVSSFKSSVANADPVKQLSEYILQCRSYYAHRKQHLIHLLQQEELYRRSPTDRAALEAKGITLHVLAQHKCMVHHCLQQVQVHAGIALEQLRFHQQRAMVAQAQLGPVTCKSKSTKHTSTPVTAVSPLPPGRLSAGLLPPSEFALPRSSPSRAVSPLSALPSSTSSSSAPSLPPLLPNTKTCDASTTPLLPLLTSASTASNAWQPPSAVPAAVSQNTLSSVPENFANRTKNAAVPPTLTKLSQLHTPPPVLPLPKGYIDSLQSEPGSSSPASPGPDSPGGSFHRQRPHDLFSPGIPYQPFSLWDSADGKMVRAIGSERSTPKPPPPGLSKPDPALKENLAKAYPGMLLPATNSDHGTVIGRSSDVIWPSSSNIPWETADSSSATSWSAPSTSAPQLSADVGKNSSENSMPLWQSAVSSSAPVVSSARPVLSHWGTADSTVPPAEHMQEASIHWSVANGDKTKPSPAQAKDVLSVKKSTLSADAAPWPAPDGSGFGSFGRAWVLVEDVPPEMESGELRVLCQEHGSIRNFCFVRSRGAALVRYSSALIAEKVARDLSNVCVGRDGTARLKGKVAHDFDLGSWLEQLNDAKEQAEQLPVERGDSASSAAQCRNMWGMGMMGMPYPNGMAGPIAFLPPHWSYGHLSPCPASSKSQD